MGVKGGKSSKCPCILCTERALLHWRHALSPPSAAKATWGLGRASVSLAATHLVEES